MAITSLPIDDLFFFLHEKIWYFCTVGRSEGVTDLRKIQRQDQAQDQQKWQSRRDTLIGLVVSYAHPMFWRSQPIQWGSARQLCQEEGVRVRAWESEEAQ